MAWLAVENQKLMYQRLNQKALRADSYKNVREATEERRRDLAPPQEPTPMSIGTDAQKGPIPAGSVHYQRIEGESRTHRK